VFFAGKNKQAGKGLKMFTIQRSVNHFKVCMINQAVLGRYLLSIEYCKFSVGVTPPSG